eukprot:3822889-Amphidinium_carterae.1
MRCWPQLRDLSPWGCSSALDGVWRVRSSRRYLVHSLLLGVVFDCSQAHLGTLAIKNKEGRVEE